MEEYTPQHMHKPYAPGKNFLLVTGILMIVFGVFALMGSLLLPFLDTILEGVLDEIYYLDLGIGDLGDIVEVSALFIVMAVTSSIILLVTGILGILWRQMIEKAQILLVLAIVFIVIDIISGILFGTIGVLSFINWILPILFIIGAVKNKQAMTA